MSKAHIAARFADVDELIALTAGRLQRIAQQNAALADLVEALRRNQPGT